MTAAERDQLLEWGHGYAEGALSREERAALETLLERDGEARRVFVDLMHDHAALHWAHVGGGGADGGEAETVAFPGSWEGANADREMSPGGWGRWRAAAAGIALVLAVGAVLMGRVSSRGDGTFAVMERTQAARWESGDLPTAQVGRLGPGRLRLVEGLATLRFDSGAQLILEAPAEIELEDAMRCRLLRGTAVAEIPEGAEGFRIATPAANVVDYGTRFAVHVEEGTGATQTQVFEGLVEVEEPGTGERVRLETGQRNYVSGGELGAAGPGPEEGTWADARETMPRGPGWTLVTTAEGRGDDGYVQSREITDHVSDVLLLVKRSIDGRGPSRKAYLRFDLSGVEQRERIAEAELTLHFTPTGWGLASVVPDAVFAVYGVTDDGLDDWNGATLRWEEAPANVAESGFELDEKKTRFLGRFTVPQGVQRGAFGIEGEALSGFLREDGNGLATVVVVRETAELGGGGLVHGIGHAVLGVRD